MTDTAFPVLYILMRNDLPSMNPGKAMAQASHASNAFVHYMSIERADEDDAVECEDLCRMWQEQTPQGFGTVLVLSVSEEQMRAAVQVSQAVGLRAGVVNDPTYPYRVDAEVAKLIPDDANTLDPAPGGEFTTMFRSEDTCAWVFAPDKNDAMTQLVLGRFPLHP